MKNGRPSFLSAATPNPNLMADREAKRSGLYDA
jgi:hypothetical protein